MSTATAETKPTTIILGTPGQRLKKLFEEFGQTDEARVLDEGQALYAEGMRFQDPMQTIDGRPEYLAMCRRLLQRSKAIRFEVHSLVETPTELFMAWRMDMQPKLGPRVVAEGATHCRLDPSGKIVWHRDYWDLVGDVVGQVPVVGRLWRGVVKRFG